MYNTSSKHMIDTDYQWNKRRDLIKGILVDLIEENNLQSKATAIFYTLDEFIKDTKSNHHLFKTDIEINQHILFNIHQYISSIRHKNSTNKSTRTSVDTRVNNEISPVQTNIESSQQQRIDSIQKSFEYTVQERDNELKPNVPPSIDFEDKNIDKYNMNTIKLLETEITSRERLISPSNSQIEEYIWLDEIQVQNDAIKLTLPNKLKSCIINRIFFMNLNSTMHSMPDYIQLKTSTGQMSWFFKYNNTNVLHYKGEMNIYTNESDIYINLDNSSNMNDINVFIQVKL